MANFVHKNTSTQKKSSSNLSALFDKKNSNVFKNSKFKFNKKKVSLKSIVGTFILFLLLVGAVSGVFLTQMGQDLRQQASVYDTAGTGGTGDSGSADTPDNPDADSETDTPSLAGSDGVTWDSLSDEVKASFGGYDDPQGQWELERQHFLQTGQWGGTLDPEILKKFMEWRLSEDGTFVGSTETGSPIGGLAGQDLPQVCTPSQIYCGGCLGGCVEASQTCNNWIDQECAVAGCGGNGVIPASGDQCCSGLDQCDNGRCAPYCAPNDSPVCGGIKGGSNCYNEGTWICDKADPGGYGHCEGGRWTNPAQSGRDEISIAIGEIDEGKIDYNEADSVYDKYCKGVVDPQHMGVCSSLKNSLAKEKNRIMEEEETRNRRRSGQVSTVDDAIFALDNGNMTIEDASEFYRDNCAGTDGGYDGSPLSNECREFGRDIAEVGARRTELAEAERAVESGDINPSEANNIYNDNCWVGGPFDGHSVDSPACNSLKEAIGDVIINGVGGTQAGSSNQTVVETAMLDLESGDITTEEADEIYNTSCRRESWQIAAGVPVSSECANFRATIIAEIGSGGTELAEAERAVESGDINPSEANNIYNDNCWVGGPFDGHSVDSPACNSLKEAIGDVIINGGESSIEDDAINSEIDRQNEENNVQFVTEALMGDFVDTETASEVHDEYCFNGNDIYACRLLGQLIAERESLERRTNEDIETQQCTTDDECGDFGKCLSTSGGEYCQFNEIEHTIINDLSSEEVVDEIGEEEEEQACGFFIFNGCDSGYECSKTFRGVCEQILVSREDQPCKGLKEGGCNLSGQRCISQELVKDNSCWDEIDFSDSPEAMEGVIDTYIPSFCRPIEDTASCNVTLTCGWNNGVCAPKVYTSVNENCSCDSTSVGESVYSEVTDNEGNTVEVWNTCIYVESQNKCSMTLNGLLHSPETAKDQQEDQSNYFHIDDTTISYDSETMRNIKKARELEIEYGVQLNFVNFITDEDIRLLELNLKKLKQMGYLEHQYGNNNNKPLEIVITSNVNPAFFSPGGGGYYESEDGTVAIAGGGGVTRTEEDGLIFVGSGSETNMAYIHEAAHNNDEEYLNNFVEALNEDGFTTTSYSEEPIDSDFCYSSTDVESWACAVDDYHSNEHDVFCSNYPSTCAYLDGVFNEV